MLREILRGIKQAIDLAYCRHDRHEWEIKETVYRGCGEAGDIYKGGPTISSELYHCQVCGEEKREVTAAGQQQLAWGATFDKICGHDPQDWATVQRHQE